MTSPIGVFTRDTRRAHGLRQHEVAKRLGYEQAYISAIELGAKIPSQEFLERLARSLELDDRQRAEMMQAAHDSQRRYVLPAEVPTEIYLLCSELWNKIDHLYPAQIVALRQVIKLDEEMKVAPRTPIARRSRNHNTEAKM